ncbi:MAG: DEAD/DEAH box helicase [Clostridium sp.]|nr:MAG: DEAD/DEAH box helicase [Clostridium sp.]
MAKTEVVSLEQCSKTVMNGKQVAYLCPTTLLSHQQYDSALKRFQNHGVNIDLINRHFTNKQVQEKLKRLKEGKIDIIFGTHRLLSNDVEFKDLGLLVIDEEHRFGVEQKKEKIKKLKIKCSCFISFSNTYPKITSNVTCWYKRFIIN